MQKKTFGTIKPVQVEPRGILHSHQEEEKAKAPKKRGRPPKEENPLTAKLTLYFTEEEMEQIKDKAGLVPVAKHLRHYLIEQGYFK
jgi:hypothetical protein